MGTTLQSTPTMSVPMPQVTREVDDDPNAPQLAPKKRVEPAPPIGNAALVSTPTMTPTSQLPSNNAIPATPDRIELANRAITTGAAATEPYYEKALRDATSQAAGAGRLGSGMLRTSLGDLARNRALDLDTLRANAINNATNSSMDDAFRTRDQNLAETLGYGNLELARTGQANQVSQFGQNLELQKAQLAESAKQFGATQAQQLALAQLADKTANRQLDLSSSQGQNALLVQLVSILGPPTGAGANAALWQSVLKALGVQFKTPTIEGGGQPGPDGPLGPVQTYAPPNGGG